MGRQHVEKIANYTTTAKSGFPSPALDYLEEPIDLNKELIDSPLSTFFVQYDLDDMVDAFIPPGTKLIIDRKVNAENGSLVLCVVGEKMRLRFLKKNKHVTKLITRSRKYPEIVWEEGNEIFIWGVVVHVIISKKYLTTCMP